MRAFFVELTKMTKHKNQIKPVDSNPNFPEMEQSLLDQWYQDGTVENYLHKNDAKKEKFYFQDGPITANNPMGVHHAWGRTYKDLWQRYKNMQGFKQRFQNGFDCQGLWVEVEVEKELGFKNKKDIETFGVGKFIELCKERVRKYSVIQTDQSKRLGYFMDWDNSYFTMSDENNYMIWHFLKKCHEAGYIYKGHDSVPWCPRCGTAISQHEMLTEDYKEAVHESVFFKLPVEGEDFSLLVWTTTPWTIPANVAVAIHPDYTYAVYRHPQTGEQLLLLESGDFDVDIKPADRVFKLIGNSYEKFKSISGSDLLNKKYVGPFDNLPVVQKAKQTHPDTFHTIIPAKDLVTPSEGTGLVHIAPGAGTEDFALGKKESLSVIAPIDEDGSYYEGFGFLSTQNAKKHPELVLDYLKEKDSVVATHHYKHRYPACWRCKTELMWRVVDEWYIGMDNGQNPLRPRLKKITKQINWIPDFGLDRELDWLKNMHDWLISKKRYWGLALPIWECPKCHQFEVIGSYDELKEKAISGWDEFDGHTPHRPFIDKIKIKCDCGGAASRIPDVGNPWLDAGIVPFSTLIDPKTKKVSYTDNQEYWKYWFPADFVTESFPGQFKNWFYSLLTMSTVLEDTPPFLNLLGFASLLAEDGRAMHKSWGNSIEFNEAAGKIGSDVMRWMFVRHTPQSNLLFGFKLADEVRRRFHMILWNSYRFYVNYACLENFVPGELTPNSDLDRWILSRLHSTMKIVTDSLDQYNAFTAANTIEDFVNDLSTWYIRRSRDRVGPTVEESEDKQSCMNVLHHTFFTLGQLLMPFTPFIADQMHRNLTGDSVHLTNWPKFNNEYIDQPLEQAMTLIRKIVEQGHAARKQSNLPVRQPLSKITISSKDGINLSPDLIELIKEELNLKEVVFSKADTDLSIELDTNLTPDLLAAGKAREVIRLLQQKRKEADCDLNEVVDATLPDWPSEYEEEIKRQALIGELRKGEVVAVNRRHA